MVFIHVPFEKNIKDFVQYSEEVKRGIEAFLSYKSKAL